MLVQDALLDALPAHVALLDGRGTIVAVNAAWRRFAAANGWVGEAGVGDDYVGVCERADGDGRADGGAVAAGIKAVLERRLPEFALEYPCHSPEEQRWFQLIVAPVDLDSTGGAIALHVNVTGRKLAEETLRDSERRQRVLARDLEAERARLVDAQSVARVGSWDTDLATLAVTWSAETYRIFDAEPASFTPTHQAFLERVHPDDRDAVATAFSSATAVDTVHTIEHRVLLPRGRVRLLEERWRIFPGLDGAPGRAVGTCHDITERRAAEQHLLRTQRLDSIGTLAGGIAHDLNNVLSPIMMAADLLRSHVTEPRALRLLDAIETSAARGAAMVKQVLAFARGVEGQRVAVDPARLLADVERIARDTFPRNISVVTRVTGPLPMLLGDSTQLQQVLINLCVNARDAMPGGGTLILEAEPLFVDRTYAQMSGLVQEGSYVLIQVSDTGHGMPPEVLTKAFDPFFTTKEIGKGTGLGLSTALAIVRSHSGFLSVDSEPGQGARFKVHLPTSAAARVVETGDVDPGPLPRGVGELVLVVDDDAAVLQVTREVLESHGYRVVTAGDGTEAVARFAQRRAEIAVVLTDMMMPFMDGAATVLALKRMDPSVRIVGASGLGAATHVEGLADFLHKPYTAEHLLRTLARVLHPTA